VNSRRRILVALGAGALALVAPPGAFSQQPGKVWRVGFLAVRPEPALQSALAQGMRDFGYVEGKNFVIESRSAEGSVERLPALADDLVRLKVDVIVTAGTVATAAARRTTARFRSSWGSADPIGRFVKSPRPAATSPTLTLRTDTARSRSKCCRVAGRFQSGGSRESDQHRPTPVITSLDPREEPKPEIVPVGAECQQRSRRALRSVAGIQGVCSTYSCDAFIDQRGDYAKDESVFRNSNVIG
jgi:putative ABC transport system substrate-binding protein